MGAIQMLKCTNHHEDLIAFHFFMFFFFRNDCRSAYWGSCPVKVALAVYSTSVRLHFWITDKQNLGPVHTNPFSNEKGPVLLRFQKDLRRIVFTRPHYKRRSREKPHGSFCPPFWILTVEWSGARSCLIWWHYRF